MHKSIITRIGIAILGFVACSGQVAAQTADKAGNPATRERDIGKAAPNSNDQPAPGKSPA